MFLRAFISSNPKLKILKCLTMDEWLNRVLEIYSMDYYSAIKSNELLIWSTTWMNLKEVMPSENSLS